MFQGSPPKIQFCIFWWCSRKSNPKISKFFAPEVNRKFQIFLVGMLVNCCWVSIDHVRFSVICLGFKIWKSWRWNAKRNDRGYTTAEAWLLRIGPLRLTFGNDQNTSHWKVWKSSSEWNGYSTPKGLKKWFLTVTGL